MGSPLADLPAAPREQVSLHAPASIVARNWVIDLRRQCFIEMGGTSRSRDIWDNIRRRVEDGEITAHGYPIMLSPGLERAVRRAARRVVANCVADDFRAVI